MVIKITKERKNQNVFRVTKLSGAQESSRPHQLSWRCCVVNLLNSSSPLTSSMKLGLNPVLLLPLFIHNTVGLFDEQTNDAVITEGAVNVFYFKLKQILSNKLSSRNSWIQQIPKSSSIRQCGCRENFIRQCRSTPNCDPRRSFLSDVRPAGGHLPFHS